MIKKILVASTALVFGASTLAYAASAPTVFPNGIESGSAIKSTDGTTQAILTPNVANGVAVLDSNKMMPAPVSGDTSASRATAKNASAARELSDHFGDRSNIRDFGAKLDGATDDTAAFQATKNNALPGQTLYLPAGNMHITGWPDTSSKLNFWEVDGTTQGGSLITSVNTDPILTHTGGGSWFFTRSVPAGADPVVRIDRNETQSGTNGYGNVSPAIQTNCNTPTGQFEYFGWCDQTIVHVHSYGGGQHVGKASNVIRDNTSGNVGGEIWAFYGAVTDSSGLEGNKTGSALAGELNTNLNGKAYATGRGILSLQSDKGNTSAYSGELNFALRISSFSNNYFDKIFDVEGIAKDAAIDLSTVQDLHVAETTTAVVHSGETVLPVGTTHNGIFVGQSVTGTGVPALTYVTAITDNTVTLSNGVSADMPSGAAVNFTSSPDAIRFKVGQHMMWGDQWHEIIFGGDQNADGSTAPKGNMVTFTTYDGADGNSGFRYYFNGGSGHRKAFEIRPEGVVLPSRSKSELLQSGNVQEGTKAYDTDDHVEVTYRCPTGVANSCAWFQSEYGSALSN